MDESGIETVFIDQGSQTMAVQRKPEPADALDIAAVVRILADHVQFLAKCTLAGLIGFLVLSFLLPRRYEAVTRLMPPDNKSSISPMMTAVATQVPLSLAADLLNGRSTGAVFVGILKSRTVSDRLIERFDLRHVYGVKYMEDARTKLAKNTSIVEESQSGIITITVTDPTPQGAANLARAYVEELDRLSALLTTSAAHRERVFIEERLKVVKQDLDSAAQDFSSFTSKNTAIDIPQQGKAMLEAVATLQGQLVAAEAELRGLDEIYTSSNVRVRAAQARVNELRSQLTKLGGGDAGADGSIDSMYPSIRKLPILGVTYADLYRRLAVQEAVFETLTKEYEMAKVQEAKEIPTVRLLDPAAVPEKKSFPPRLLISVLGTSLAFVVGICWVIGCEAWRRVDPQDPQKMLVAELLTTFSLQVHNLRQRRRNLSDPDSRDRRHPT